MLLVIDNYDSFTWNLVHHLGELGAKAEVVRNDALGVDDALGAGAQAIILSPGPCTPSEAGICVDLVRTAPAELPILGVCLGHQAIGAACGAKVIRCHEILHGKLSRIGHAGTDIFRGLPQGFEATRYHSLVIDPTTLPTELNETARVRSGAIMGIAHVSRPVYGVQFHPESIRTEHGHRLLRNFLEIAGAAPT